MKNFYVMYGTAFFGPYKTWAGAYFAGLEIFGFWGWKIVCDRSNTKKNAASICAILALIGFFSISSCCPKIYGNHEFTQKDSIRVEIRTITVHDTTKFEILREVEKIVTKQDSSSLENKYAKSSAWVDKDGNLHHSLETKPQTIPVPVSVAVSDTTTFHAIESHEKDEKTVGVEKPLSRWESFKIGAFWWLITAVVGLLAWIFRKPILSLLKFNLK